MKKLPSIFVLCIITLVLTSCGSNSNEAKKQSILEEAKNHFGERTDLIEIRFRAADALDSDIEEVKVYSKKDDELFSQEFSFEKGLEPEESVNFLQMKRRKPVAFSSFPIDSIYKDYDKCLAFLKENFTGEDELDDYTFYSWSAETNAKAAIEVEVSVNATIKSEGTHRQGRNIVTNYYEFKFKKLADGSMKYVEQ